LGDESANSKMSADEQRKLAAIMFTICLDHVRLNI